MKDNYNKQLYKETFDEISASDALKGKVIYMNKQNNKSNKVQHRRIKRSVLILVAAICVLVIGTVAVAAANNFWIKSYEGKLKEQIELHDMECWTVEGELYKGYMLKISDPSRVFLGTIDEFGESDGKSVAEMISAYDAVAGVNGGASYWNDTAKYTGLPVGAVISEGEIAFSDQVDSYVYDIVGFTKDNKLIIGPYTLEEALNAGIRDAVSYGGTFCEELVIDGSKAIKKNGGINPRTAIGQCEDGTVILLVIDGRQEGSLGANTSELAEIMLEAGAVNAVSMAGGSYTSMYVESDSVNNSFRVEGALECPDAWLVR